MSELQIILDKSVVYGLLNSEIDSLDKYFFLIVPPILVDEILADLAKEAQQSKIKTKIAQHSYRISGNRGLTVDHLTVLLNSLMGNDPPMDGNFISVGESTVRSEDDLIGTISESFPEDEIIARWEEGKFTASETAWATKWRGEMERSMNPHYHLKHIAKAGLEFTPPKSDEDLAGKIDALLDERKFQGRLLTILFKEFGVPEDLQREIMKRWFKEGKPILKDFAQYAHFCARANFLWTLGMTNPGLFSPDKNDRKDLEYCYYLPHCEIFASKDRKHKRLVPFLLRPNQTFITENDEFKQALRQLSEQWEAMSREERIKYHSERGSAPPENKNSIVFQFWKKHRNKISPPAPLELLDMKLVDSSLPEDERVPFTLREFLNTTVKKLEASEPMPYDEAVKLNQAGENDPRVFAVRRTRIRKDRALKLYPNLTKADLEKKDSE